MSFKVQYSKDDKCELVFADEPSYIHALKGAPEAMEPELNLGVWLIVTFPVWSVPDRHSVHAAIDCTKGYIGKFKLGVRPFNEYKEISKWWPISDASSASTYSIYEIPKWLVLRDGHVIYEGVGLRSKEQLDQLMRTILV